jgi:O-methyltransferase
MDIPVGQMRRYAKLLIQRIFRAFGYEVSRRGAPDMYMSCPPYGYFTYAAWREDWFQAKYDRIRQYTLVTDDRCYMLYRLAQHCARLDGDFAECGVYRGGTAMLLAEALQEQQPTRHLHLFDTFTGMPDSANTDASAHRRGEFADTTLPAVQTRLGDWTGARFHAGLIPQTFTAVEERTFAFAHVDVDLYASTRDCLAFFYPRLTPGGIMLCDDYGAPAYIRSAKLALDEFFADKPEQPISLRTGQCLIIKI